MFKKIGIAVVVVIAVILILASRQPDDFTLQRSTLIKAKPEKVFAQINDFHNWGAWDPWAKMDPSMKVTFSGAANGKGAQYAWEGNGQVGSGSMEIVESTVPTKVDIQLNFLKPMKGQDTATFTLQPQGDSTQVTWAMAGKVPFIGKIFHLFMNMDKMVGSQFDKGLADLKAVSEK
jgi:hypothetical protein